MRDSLLKAKPIPSGKVEIIVSASYLENWPIRDIAHRMGYDSKVTENYELGFENVKPQKSEAVKSGKQASKSLITLVSGPH